MGYAALSPEATGSRRRGQEQAFRGPSRGTVPDNTFTLGLQTPELRENISLLFKPRPWHLVMGAAENQDR